MYQTHREMRDPYSPRFASSRPAPAWPSSNRLYWGNYKATAEGGLSDCGHVETRKWLKQAPTWRRDEDALLTGPIAKLPYRRVVNLGFMCIVYGLRSMYIHAL